MKLIIIAAIGKNNELGLNNDLIWRIKEDLNFFKEKTMNHYIVMGKNTFLSLKRLLPNRKHLVISSLLEEIKDVKIYKSIEEFLNDKTLENEEIYVIGGYSIYKELIKYASIMYLTHINETKEASVFFPMFDTNLYNVETLGEYEENNLQYTRKKYTKK